MSTPETTNERLLLIARAIHDGLGRSWAYKNYGGDEWNSMRAELLAAAREVVKVLGLEDQADGQ
jgi:hypothetical protein